MTQVKANGLDIEFESFGRTNDPAVLLIGGVGEQLTQWRELCCARALPRKDSALFASTVAMWANPRI